MSSSEVGIQDGLLDIDDSTPGFLRLPRELRDQIYGDTLDLAAQSPPSIRKIVEKNSILGVEGGSQGVVYNYHGRRRAPPISCAGLLGTNHQISDEMCEYILRRNNKAEDGVQYHLYLIACYKSLLPIWLSLPTPLTFVRTLRVDMQLSSHRSFQWGGSVNALAEASLQLFLRFFRHGPQLSEDRDGLPQKEQLRYRMPYLDMLTINLVPEPSRGDSQPVVIDRMTFRYLGSYLGVIARSDLFRGKIKAFRLRYGDLVQDHIIQPRKAP